MGISDFKQVLVASRSVNSFSTSCTIIWVKENKSDRLSTRARWRSYSYTGVAPIVYSRLYIRMSPKWNLCKTVTEDTPVWLQVLACFFGFCLLIFSLNMLFQLDPYYSRYLLFWLISQVQVDSGFLAYGMLCLCFIFIGKHLNCLTFINSYKKKIWWGKIRSTVVWTLEEERWA